MITTRRDPQILKPGRVTCGNCHGTGGENFNMINDDPCDACDGRGWHEIDPNAKTMTLREFLEELKK